MFIKNASAAARRLLARAGLTALALPLLTPISVYAQDFPNRPLRLIVPYGTGGPTDMVARELGNGLQKVLGEPVVVENRPGGGSIIGVDHVAKADGDGHTLLFATAAPFVINPHLNSALPYKVGDFTPVSKVATYSMVLAVGPQQNWGSMQEMVAYGKANPGALSFASAGNGTSNHLAGELLQSLTGLKMMHVPYRGNAPAMTDVIAGNVSMMFDMPATTVPHVQSGRVRLLGSTSTTRNPLVPETPTIAEQGVEGFDVTSWFGVFVPKATPEEIVDRLNNAIGEVLNDPALIAKLKSVGYEVASSSPVELAASIGEEGRLWSDVIAKAQIRVE